MSHQPRLNVAIIGCGEIAQCAHLPNLKTDSERWNILAVCDVSSQAAELCAQRFHVPQTFSNVEDLLKEGLSLDVVFILTADQYHAEYTILCAKSGINVFLEKPMAQTQAEADAIIQTARDFKVVVFVGYMRRYAKALGVMKELIKGKLIKYIRVRDIIGKNELFTKQSGMHLRYFNDINQAARQELTQRREQNLLENLGADAFADRRNMHSWSMLGGLACHDLSALRELVGMPQRCLLTTRSDDGDFAWWWTSLFDYGQYKVYYEMGYDNVISFDAHIEVYTNDERIKIQYQNPYIRALPINITVQSQDSGGNYREEVIRATYEDPYVSELNELHECLANGASCKTDPQDAKNDLDFVFMMMKSLVE